MGTCKAELHVNILPWMLLVFQDKIGHGAVAVFSKETQQLNSRKITLADFNQENRACAGLSGETVALISSLLLLKHNPRLRKSLKSILWI